jgi:acetylornithine/succinyldiaminopimelate/putrescine aminotransferase/predicted amino acid dehydrogenase
MELLRAIGLDVVYERGLGDLLFFRDAQGREVEVLDMLGGYGASLFGHNHPALLARAREVLEARRPFNAQASARGIAGHLAKRLSDAVGRTTGRSYVVTLASSGTEAVEAAIKHAEIEAALRADQALDRIRRKEKEIRLRLRDNTAFLPDGLFARAARLLDVPRIDDLDGLFMRVLGRALEALGREPVFLALEGAFHGKTTGSLKITHNPEYRSHWRRIGLRARFLPFAPAEGPEAAIGREVERARLRFVDLEIGDDGAVGVVERELANVSACFVEPIQGEGGIREVPAAYLRALREAADRGGFPLVVDEIQCGMGRTGTFLASAPAGVRGDYYLFSKALGGGLAKISACLVDEARYVAAYGYLHTSTFADDDFSSAIALAALDLLEADGGALVRACAEKGERLMARLRELRARYPDELREVRGRGLMIGLELAPAARARSPLLRVLSEQSLLGFFVSGTLLHEERVRVAPTLSFHQTIRLEPSAAIPDEAIDRFCGALERTLAALHEGDAYRIARFLAGRAGEDPPRGPRPAPREPPAFTAPGWAPSRFARKVAFLGHFLEPGDLRHWDPSLAPLADAECEVLLERTRGVLDPFIVERTELRSQAGDLVNLTVIGLAFTTGWAIELIEKAVDLAKRLGCAVIGFGGYTSIVTDNCRAIIEDEVALTSGNSLTAAAALEALDQAARRVGIEAPRLGVVGGAGNIGAVLAEVAADRVPEVLLVGRPGAAGRLEQVAAEVYFGAWKRLVRQGAEDGLAGAIAGTETVRALRAGGAAGVERIGEAIRRGLLTELGARAPVRVATDMDALASCNLILSATNAPKPVNVPAHLGPGPVVICDVAPPRDVDPSVRRARPDVVVLKGGIVKAPLGQSLEIAGMPLEAGQIYGCLAETVLMGMAGVGEHFSFGKLTAARVRRVHELARMHGFVIEERPRDD